MANLKRERDIDNEEEEGNIYIYICINIYMCVFLYIAQFQVSNQVNVANMLTNRHASCLRL